MIEFTFTSDAMKKWGIGLWSLFIFVILLILGIGSGLLYLYYKANVLIFYMSLLGGELLLYIVLGLGLRKCYDFHMHHYTIAMTALTMICHQNIFIVIINGILTGMMIEGGSRWGYDPVWIKKQLRSLAVKETEVLK
jgi:hypothetical protein